MSTGDIDLEIEALIQRLENAWNDGDAVAWVQDCLEDADFINIRGEVLPGRRGNEARHAAMFAGPFRGSRITISIRRVQSLTPEAAIVETDCRLVNAPGMPAGIQPTEPGVLLTRLKLVLAHRDKRWWIATSQNTAVIPGPP